MMKVKKIKKKPMASCLTKNNLKSLKLIDENFIYIYKAVIGALIEFQTL